MRGSSVAEKQVSGEHLSGYRLEDVTLLKVYIYLLTDLWLLNNTNLIYLLE